MNSPFRGWVPNPDFFSRLPSRICDCTRTPLTAPHGQRTSRKGVAPNGDIYCVAATNASATSFLVSSSIGNGFVVRLAFPA